LRRPGLLAQVSSRAD